MPHFSFHGAGPRRIDALAMPLEDDDRIAPDALLVERARSGHRAAFDRLVERYGDAVLAYLTRMSRDRDDAMDAFQNTFLRAFLALPKLRDPARFRGWLFRIAANAARKLHARAALESTRADLDPVDPAGLEHHASPVATERHAALRHCIAELPDRQRQALSLRLDAGLSYREIAEIMGIREDNARAHHYQALKKLRARLAAASGFEAAADDESPGSEEVRHGR